DVNGLPHQVIREMAHQRNFLNYQESINHHEDELAQYQFLENMLVKEKTTVAQKLLSLKQTLEDIQKRATASKAHHEPSDVQERWLAKYRATKKEADFYRFRLSVQLDSRKAFALMREQNSVIIGQSKK